MRTCPGLSIPSLPAEWSAVQTRARFREWLLSRTKPMAVRHSYECPLATCVNESLPRGAARVGLSPDAADDEPGFPHWHATFGKLVDAEPGPTITPARCIEILDSIPEDAS